jgi:hypothetical protein
MSGTNGTSGHPYRVVSLSVPPECPGQSPEMSRPVPVSQWDGRTSAFTGLKFETCEPR